MVELAFICNLNFSKTEDFLQETELWNFIYEISFFVFEKNHDFASGLFFLFTKNNLKIEDLADMVRKKGLF